MKRTRPGRLMFVPGMVLTCILLASCPSAFALNPALDVSQYAHTSWKIRDGFTKGEISSIAQTPDGYLWLGTELGLYRFDGVKNVLWRPPMNQDLPSSFIFSLLVTRDGTLWIGTAKGLASWKDGQLTQYPELAGYYIFTIIEDHEGDVWASGIGVTTGRLCAIRAGNTQCYGDDGTFGRGVFNLYEDSRGNLWAGVKNGLWHWNPGPPKFFPLAGEPDGIRGLGEAEDGTLLVGWNGRLNRIVDGKVQPFQLQAPAFQFRAKRILRDRDGGLWIGTTDHGVLHVQRRSANAVEASQTLPSESVNVLFEDRERNIWVATRTGLDRYREFAVATFRMNAEVNSVLADKNGGVWVATNNGLGRSNDGETKYILADGRELHPFSAKSLFQDDGGRVWVSTPFELGYLSNDRFVSLISVPGAVTGIAQDTTGNLWVANEHAGLFQVLHGSVVRQISWPNLGHTDHVSTMTSDPVRGGVWLGFFLGGIAYFGDGRIQNSYNAEQGLAGGRVSDLQVAQDGSVWIATEEGLSRLKNGVVTTLTSRNGLPCDAVHWLREDKEGAVWLYTPCGLMRIPRAELNDLATAVEHNINARRTITAIVFDNSDGVMYLASGSHLTPQVAKSTDGNLWFPGSDGLSTVDPSHLRINNIPPPVHIEQFIADHQIYDATSSPDGRLRLPPLIRDLQIDYTALSLVAPEKIAFRYMLEGRDSTWQEAGNRRHAFYNDLPPGPYRFRVIACNNSGIWNETGTFLDFSIEPAYYQTNWFRMSIAAAFLLLLGLLYQLRVRQVAGQVRARMEERLEERERIARDLHDTLLQSVQGLILKFDAVGKQIPGDQPAHKAIQKILDRADEVLAEGRDRVRNLRASTIPMGGLPAAFESVVEQYSQNGKASFKTLVEGSVRELHPMVREEAYIIGREALINAVTHSDGNRVEVEIAYDPRQFRLRVRDDGRGFDPKILENGGLPNHFGLQGMRERAGRIGAELKIWSGRQTGTEIELLVPGITAYKAARPKAKHSWFSRIFRKLRINADDINQSQ
ncbi:MAG TPA: two-component regulator propeller domain-containing protein [Pyrinomonadaceae bacterium]